jgi:AcrR family transcriptional regulator
MTLSLRERQKAKRAREILESAAALIAERGYPNTTVEDIAMYAFVAPGTVYNYFGSKDGILREIMRAHINERHIERERFLQNPPDDLNSALDQFVDLLLDQAFVLVNPEIWRQVLASSITANGDTDLFDEVTETIVSQFERLFLKFKEREIIPDETSLRDLSEAAMAIADFYFYRIVRRNNFDAALAKQKIRTQLRMLLKGVVTSVDP